MARLFHQAPCPQPARPAITTPTAQPQTPDTALVIFAIDELGTDQQAFAPLSMRTFPQHHHLPRCLSRCCAESHRVAHSWQRGVSKMKVAMFRRKHLHHRAQLAALIEEGRLDLCHWLAMRHEYTIWSPGMHTAANVAMCLRATLLERDRETALGSKPFHQGLS